MPRPPESVQVPYAQSRDELAGLSDGELTQIVLDTQAFKDEIGAICAEMDQARAGKRGSKPAYTSLELESVFVYQRVCGLKAVKEARDRLAGDRGADARRLFGLNQARPLRGRRVQHLRNGVPSDSTLSRHRQRFGEERRRQAYERLFKALVQEHLDTFPEMREEARILHLDGSTIETHYTCPKYSARKNGKPGRLLNGSSVTCPDGGFVPSSAGADHSGHGFNSLCLVTLSGLPLANAVVPMHASESVEGERLLDGQFRNDVHPHLDQGLGILAADGGFHNHGVRGKAHDLGLVEVIHKVSHADAPGAKRNARQHDRMRREIRGYPNWQVNGHDELICRCGHGQVAKRIEFKNGKAIIRSEGSCTQCGSITLTPGLWRSVQNPSGFVRCQPDEHDRADWAFGNPLTYNDPLARVYGIGRWSHNESFHGQMTTRFQLFKNKRWFRTKDQARTDVAIVYSIIHCLAMEQRRRKQAATSPSARASSAAGSGPGARSSGGPPLPLAA